MSHWTMASSAPLSSGCEGTPGRCVEGWRMSPWNSWRKVTSMMTFRTPASWKSLIKRSAFYSPRQCDTFLRSVLYPALVPLEQPLLGG
jgi:hypothetical protein